MKVGRDQVALVMSRLGLRGISGTRKRYVNREHLITAEDLVQRKFTAKASNQLWCTDITEHPTREGKVYCCCVLDVYSRKIVGWAIGTRQTTNLVLNALDMAIEARKPTDTVIHSDHGTQGGFNRSSQHFEVMEVCDGSPSTSSRSCDSTEDEVAWVAVSSA